MAPAVGRVHRALLPEPTPEPVLEYADQKDQFATTNSTPVSYTHLTLPTNREV